MSDQDPTTQTPEQQPQQNLPPSLPDILEDLAAALPALAYWTGCVHAAPYGGVHQEAAAREGFIEAHNEFIEVLKDYLAFVDDHYPDEAEEDADDRGEADPAGRQPAGGGLRDPADVQRGEPA